MKLRKLLIILAVVLFLFSLVLVKKSMQVRDAGKEAARNELAGGLELIKEIPDAFLSKIVVYKGGDEKGKLVLAKDKDGTWIVENKFGTRARKEAISDLLRNLKGLKGEIRGDAKELFPDFQIEDEKAVRLVLEGPEGKALKHLVISFLLPAVNKNFVRDADSPKVVLVDKNLLADLNIFGKEDTLRALPFVDLKPITFDAKGINGITLERSGKEKIVLKKVQLENSGNFIWSFEPSVKDEEIDQAKVDTLLQAIGNIYATDVMDPGAKTYGLENPLFRVELASGAVNNVIQMDVGNYNDTEKSYYIKTSSSGSVFKVPETYIAGLKEDKTSFLKPKAESAKEAK